MLLFNSAPLSTGPHPVSSSKSGFSVTLSLKLQLADFSTVTAAFFATSRWRPLCHYALQHRRTTQTLPSTLTLTIYLPFGPHLEGLVVLSASLPRTFRMHFLFVVHVFSFIFSFIYIFVSFVLCAPFRFVLSNQSIWGPTV